MSVAVERLDDTATPKRLGLRFAYGWLVLVACIEFTFGYLLAQFGEPIEVPALAVAGVGLGLGMLGCFVAGELNDRGKANVPVSVRHTLGIGTFSLPVLSLGWNLGGNAFWVLPAACSVAVVGGFVCLVGAVSRGKRAEKRTFVATILLLTASVILSLFAWAVPNGLSLKFAWSEEAGLNRQVGGESGSSLGIPGHPGWIFYKGPDAAYEGCARHLIGPWWEVTGDTPFCPTGFIYVSGG